MGKADVKVIALTALGVFVAGLVMNAFRKNDFVNNAINGFDA